MAQLHFLGFYNVLNANSDQSQLNFRDDLREFRKIYDSLRAKDGFGQYLVLNMSTPNVYDKIGKEYILQNMESPTYLDSRKTVPNLHYSYAVLVDGIFFEVKGKSASKELGRDQLIPLLAQAQMESDDAVIRAKKYLAQPQTNANNNSGNGGTTPDKFGFSPWMMGAAALIFLLATAGEKKKKPARK